jgi:Amt family ammonium transporter
MLMQNVFCMGLISVLWAAIGFTLAFGGTGDVIGNFDFIGLKDLIDTPPPGFEALTIPPLLFMAYQMMFAVITPALITGAVADRMRFSAWMLFSGAWLILVYTPVAHWVFSPAGWLFERGALDFAGGTVVHINAGAAALAAAIVIGKRRGWPREAMPPHNLTMTLVGTGILWFGWFGFNAGSALGANTLAATAFVNTNLAAAAAMLGWLLVERLKSGHATTLGAASGAVAGLVAITPCAGFVGGMAPVVIGALAGIICFFAVSLKHRFGYDDALDVVGVHLVGGIVGSILLGFFADVNNNAAGQDGVFFGGGAELLGEQVLAVVVTAVYSFVVSWIILKVIQLALPGGLRVSEEDEETGLDLTEHSEVGYALSDVGAMVRH